jgi:hypothetical protein
MEDFMQIDSRRRYLNKFATMMAAVTGAPILFAQQPPQSLLEIGLAAATTHTMESITSPALVLMTATPKTITFS